MKHILLPTIVILMTAIFSFSLSACSGDDDAVKAEDDLLQILKSNKWLSKYSGMNEYSYGIEMEHENYYLYFGNDGYGMGYQIYSYEDSTGDNGLDKFYVPFTYTISGNNVTIRYTESGDYNSFTYSSGKLYDKGSDKHPVYDSMPLSSSDDDILRRIEQKDSGSNIYGNKEDLTCYVGFTSYASTRYTDGEYTHCIQLGFGVSKGFYSAGVRKIGISLYSADGTITNEGIKSPLSMTNRNVGGVNMKYVYANITDNEEHKWVTPIFVKSKYSSVTLKYVISSLDNGVEIDSEARTYHYVPDKINGNDNPSGGGDNPSGGGDNPSGGGNNPLSISVTTNSNPIVNIAKATITGKVTGVNSPVEVGILYGTTRNLSESNGKRESAMSQNDFSITLRCLNEECTYYYCAYAIVNNRFYKGDIKQFRTEAFTYIMNGKKYKWISVEGENISPYCIMQTEWTDISSVDSNSDGCISKAEFRVFLKKLSEDTGLDLRLPTLNEWQFAARGGNKSLSYTYSGSNSIDDVAWYSQNSDNSPHQAALKNANELGLYDMSGNYAEICYNANDIYNVDGYVCGGSWKDSSSKCKTTSYDYGKTDGFITGKTVREKNAIDARYISFRLVFTQNQD